MVRIRVTQPGFYQRVLVAGDETEVPENLFSSEWMERVEAEPKKRGRKADKEDDA